jgi:hypothetical protein
MSSPNSNFEPFLSCALVESESSQTFKDLPIGALFVNFNEIAFVKITELEAVNLYHQQVVNFGPREYEDFDGKKFTFSNLDSSVLLLRFYA